MSRRPSPLPYTTIRRCVPSRWIWFGPSVSTTSASALKRHESGRRWDQEIASPVVERFWSERRITTSKRRLPSTICETLRPFDSVSRACVTAAGVRP